MQDCIGVTYTATQSILELSAKVQDCIGVTYTATQSILGLFKLEVNFHQIVSAKVQDCIGVTYTATQSTLELFQQKCKIALKSLIQQLNQYWDYLC